MIKIVICFVKVVMINKIVLLVKKLVKQNHL